jgi:hypothetical protein
MQCDFLPSFLGKIITVDLSNPTFYSLIYLLPNLSMFYIELKHEIYAQLGGGVK